MDKIYTISDFADAMSDCFCKPTSYTAYRIPTRKYSSTLTKYEKVDGGFDLNLELYKSKKYEESDLFVEVDEGKVVVAATQVVEKDGYESKTTVEFFNESFQCTFDVDASSVRFERNKDGNWVAQMKLRYEKVKDKRLKRA